MAAEFGETAREIGTILANAGLDGMDSASWSEAFEQVSRRDVERALASEAGSYSLERLLVLTSPAAEDYLEQMAQAVQALSVRRFGRTIRLYAPLYVSNYCVNRCRYCGFNELSASEKVRLDIGEAIEEAQIIAQEGFRDLLLVSGDDREYISCDYLCELARRLRGRFSTVSVEVYQMETSEYARLFTAGIDGVTVYQETYDRGLYERYHPVGGKADYDDRVATPGRAAAAGMRQIGLGVLLGLADWRVETLALAEHAHCLIKRHWQSHVSFSFPRLRPAHDVSQGQFEHLLSDKNLVQMMMALRLCFADVGLVLSTRERAELRDNLIGLGVTKMSAGSKTRPGGYSGRSCAVEQFEVDDTRSAAEVAAAISQRGFEPVWKDWDSAFVEPAGRQR